MHNVRAESNQQRQLCAHITGNFRQSRKELRLRLAKVQPFGCMNVLQTQWAHSRSVGVRYLAELFFLDSHVS
jgi:hypothetical protein